MLVRIATAANPTRNGAVPLWLATTTAGYWVWTDTRAFAAVFRDEGQARTCAEVVGLLSDAYTLEVC